MKYIKIYQKQNGLKVDGIIGKNTIKSMLDKFGLSPFYLALFLGQTHHETAGFTKGVENLNYSPSRLLDVFPIYFKTMEKAKVYGHQPKKIANYVYDDKNRRNGYKLGNVCVDDGWKYRGRGAGHITGRTNYKRFAIHIEDCKVISNPEIVEKKYFFESALFYAEDKNIFKGISADNIHLVSKRWNGGYNGFSRRYYLMTHYMNQFLKCGFNLKY